MVRTSTEQGINDRAQGGQMVGLADSTGRPFYYLASGGQCAADCLTRWRPAIADPRATATGDFSLLSLDDGKRQWAFRGKALYVSASGPSLSDPLRLPDWNMLDPPSTLGLQLTEGEDGMKLTIVDPNLWTRAPFNIGVAEYRLAPGHLLALGVSGSNPMGRPLYLFSGAPQQEQALPAMFKPAPAPGLAVTIGDFTVRERADSSRQWAYRGAPLYTCDCDVSVGDVNGAGAAPGISPALLFRYFVPAEVTIVKDNLSVGRMVQAKTGKTLYFRDRLEDDYIPDHARPGLGTNDPKVGALLGLSHCSQRCEKEWLPLLASKDAQPQGFWSLYERPDGKRQWAYKNYAIYTHADEAPGSLDGNETYLVQFADGHGNDALPKEFGMGLNWRAVVP